MRHAHAHACDVEEQATVMGLVSRLQWSVTRVVCPTLTGGRRELEAGVALGGRDVDGVLAEVFPTVVLPRRPKTRPTVFVVEHLSNLSDVLSRVLQPT